MCRGEGLKGLKGLKRLKRLRGLRGLRGLSFEFCGLMRLGGFG
jgi:hypothetical protein